MTAEHETRHGALLNVGLRGAAGAHMRPAPSMFPHIQRYLEPQVLIVRHVFLGNNSFFPSLCLTCPLTLQPTPNIYSLLGHQITYSIGVLAYPATETAGGSAWRELRNLP